MCNEPNSDKTPTREEIKDYRFIGYRLNQLEHNLRRGQERLEQEYKEQNKQIMATLTLMQEGLNQQNASLVELKQRVTTIEERNKNIDKLSETATKNATTITELERRMDIYKQILVGVVIALCASILLEIIKFI